MGRPRNLAQNLVVYLTVCRIRRECRLPDGDQVPLSWCYDAVRKMLAKHQGVNLSEEGTVRAAYAEGKRISKRIAERLGLPALLNEEQQAEKVEWHLIGAAHSAETAERMARTEQDEAHDRAYYDLILKRASEILARTARKARPGKKSR